MKRGLALAALVSLGVLAAQACVKDVAVGIAPEQNAPDASAAGSLDASLPSLDGAQQLDGTASSGPCDEAACTTPRPLVASYTCEDGSSAGPICARRADQSCGWVVVSCPPPRDAGTPPPECKPIECTGPQLISIQSVGCNDGSAPLCMRDATGLCVLQCKPEAACSGKNDPSCGAGSTCVFPTGMCGKTAGSGVCQKLPDTCPKDAQPACGCDGKTYLNPCSALTAGVSVAFEGYCTNEPQPCVTDQCPAPAPGGASTLCADGVHASGPACLQKPGGGCAWQWLECPSAGNCDARTTSLTQNGCWVDADCKNGLKCVGASTCPCGATCFAADRPGSCQ